MTHSAEAAGCRGVFAVSMVMLLLILATLAVMGPYQLVLVELHRIFPCSEGALPTAPNHRRSDICDTP